MYGLLSLLVHSVAAIARTVADENGKAEGKARAIQNGDCVYFDRHGAMRSVRTDEFVHTQRIDGRVVYCAFKKGGGTYIVEDPDRKKWEARKREEVDRMKNKIIDKYRRAIYFGENYVMIDKSLLKGETDGIIYYLKLDEKIIFYKRYNQKTKEYYAIDLNGQWYKMPEGEDKETLKIDLHDELTFSTVDKKTFQFNWLLDYDYEDLKQKVIKEEGGLHREAKKVKFQKIAPKRVNSYGVIID